MGRSRRESTSTWRWASWILVGILFGVSAVLVVLLLLRPGPPETWIPDEGWFHLTRDELASEVDGPGHRPLAPKPWSLLLSAYEPYHPDLGFPAHGSISVGTVTGGYLVEGVQIPPVGDHYELLAVPSERGTQYATDELYALVQEVGAAVAEVAPETKLLVANASKGGGGDIPWSSSHNAGRDIDLFYYLVDTDGNQLVPDHLFPVPESLEVVRGGTTYTFDPALNWLAVKALVTSEAASIQWIFIANHLKKAIVDYAQDSGEPASLVAKAKKVLRQPRFALPHDDHMHIRIYCAPSDVLEGCKDISPFWPWFHKDLSALSARKKALSAKAATATGAELYGALFVMDLLRIKLDEALVVHAVEVGDAATKTLVVQMVVARGTKKLFGVVWDLLQGDEAPSVRLALLEGAADKGGTKNLSRLLGLTTSEDLIVFDEPFYAKTIPVGVRAVGLLAAFRRLEVIEGLLPLVGSDDLALDAAVEETLAKVANASHGIEASQATAEVRATWWAEWLDQHRKSSPDEWLVEGFEAKGYEIAGLDKKAIPSLVQAITDPAPWLSLNARFALQRITKEKQPTHTWTTGDADFWWRRWYKRHYKKVLPSKASFLQGLFGP